MSLNSSDTPKDPPVCPYCNRKAKLVTGRKIYSDYTKRGDKYFWVCWFCDAYVGCHSYNSHFGLNGTEPLGTLANKQLRTARIKVHKMFDPTWKVGNWDRTKAYMWLATRLGVPTDECHIGNFDLETCVKAIKALKGIRRILNLKGKESLNGTQED